MGRKVSFEQLLTEVRDSDIDGIGSIREGQFHTYRYVKNAETNVDFVAGNAVAHDTATLGAAAVQKVYKPTTALLGSMAGIVVGSLGAGKYGYIVVKGPWSTVSVSGATTGGVNIANNDYLKMVNGQTYMVRDAATQGAYSRMCQIAQAVTTTTTPAAAACAAYVDCL